MQRIFTVKLTGQELDLIIERLKEVYTPVFEPEILWERLLKLKENHIKIKQNRERLRKKTLAAKRRLSAKLRSDGSYGK